MRYEKKKFLLSGSVLFCLYLALIAGVNGLITIDSPLNITYNSSAVDLNVSTSSAGGGTWKYSLDGGDNVTFTPNTTIEGLDRGPHYIEVFYEYGGGTGSLYGNGTYGSGLYGYASTGFTVESSDEYFSIFLGFILAEIFIVFELFGFYLLYRGIVRKDLLLYPILAMVMFFTLAVSGSLIQPIGTETVFTYWEAIMFNYMMGFICLLYVFFFTFFHMRQELTP